MSKPFPDDAFLARWLNGELSQEEEASLQARDDYAVLKRMAEESSQLELPSYSEGAAWEKLLAQKKARKTGSKSKVRSLRRVWWYAAAAVIGLLGVGYWYWMDIPTPALIVTAIGEQYEGELPDGSKVRLNAVGELDYDAEVWSEQRKLSLSGEAFFEVKKGETFTVETPSGQIEVLGTSFNVWARDSQLEVVCHSGKVKVMNGANESEIVVDQKAVLNAAGGFDITNLQLTPTPSWFRGWTACEGWALTRVFEELSRRYGITVDWEDESYRVYDGGFPNDDLEKAIYFICDPMGLDYTLSEDNTRVSIRAK